MYIHLNRKHAMELKFGMYLPCVAFHKFDVAILKISLFGHFMAKNPILPPLFASFLAIRWSKSMFPVQMNVPFFSAFFQYRDFSIAI